MGDGIFDLAAFADMTKKRGAIKAPRNPKHQKRISSVPKVWIGADAWNT
jgi:hypothetical protein